MLRSWLAHPSTRNIDLDDPRTTIIRREIIHEKKFVHKIYQEWYSYIKAVLPKSDEPVLEIGSGAGFLNEYIPNLITSDTFINPWLSVVLDGQRLPLDDEALQAIVMNNVLHHIPQIRDFLAEATRCIKVGGVLAMIEPWATKWSKLIYSKLHHETFDATAANWAFPSSKSLADANIALPWIIFDRDKELFEHEFPQWRIQEIRPFMPFCYLGSPPKSVGSKHKYMSWRTSSRSCLLDLQCEIV